MASTSSQAISRSKELAREGDGEEDDGEELLDPRVKGELDRLNSSTAEINRLEQDLEELQAAFRQTLTESAYVLNGQAAFLGKCVNHARPYYDAMRKAKQSQIETQKAALKYERACTSHQAAKKMLAIAEQKLVSTSKEHKVLDPTWQEMLNQAILKVIDSDKERALSEKEHLDTARAFSEAGNKVTELRTKLKSAISKSRPYFDLKMKYDQLLEGHKRQVEITQEGLQEAKKKYSLALKNLEGISEEIHEMRRSRESLDTILHEREEGVGAESPVGDLSHDALRPLTENCVGSTLNKRTYGFKIAVVSASKKVDGTVGIPVGERDGVLEGCSSFDEQQLDFVGKKEKLSEDNDNESRTEARSESCSSEAGLNLVCQDEADVLPAGSCEKQDQQLRDEEEKGKKVGAASANERCDTGKHLAEGEELCRAMDDKSDPVDETAIEKSWTENPQEQKSITGAGDVNYVSQHWGDCEVSSSTDEVGEPADNTGGTLTQESLPGNASDSNSEKQRGETENEKVTERDSIEESNDEASQPDHIGQTVTHESLTDNASGTSTKEGISLIESENERNPTNQDMINREESNSIDAASEPGQIAQAVSQELSKESASVTNSPEKKSGTEVENEIDSSRDSVDGEELRTETDNDGHLDFLAETANQQLTTENASEQKSKTEAEDVADREQLVRLAENDSTSDEIDETGIPKTLIENEFITNSQEQRISSEDS